MNTKIFIILIVILAVIFGGYIVKKFLFDTDNKKTVWLEWQSKSDKPNPWEAWEDGPLFEVSPTERDLMELYYQHKFNPEIKIIDYKYKKYKGPIILDYKQIKTQDVEEYEQKHIQKVKNWEVEGAKEIAWQYKIQDKRGLIIRISVSNKFKNKFLEDGWKITEKPFLGKIEVYIDEDENDSSNTNEIHIGDITNREGKLELSIITAGESALKLQKAFADITSRKSLQSREDVQREIDGEVVNVSTRIDVELDPNNPRYIWAIANSLGGEYGFNCSVVYIEEKNNYELAIYLLANTNVDANIDRAKLPQHLSELKLDPLPLFTIDDIVSYDWEEHNFILTEEAEKKIASKLRFTNNTLVPFVVMVKGERIYKGIFQDLISEAVYKDIPFIRFYVSGDRDENRFDISSDLSKAHDISFNSNKNDTWIDPRNDSRIKQILENEQLILNSDNKK
ncbi:hypothetical protein KKC67_01195 [Patescibacteria group bacterium]|nr:hypothetical protein [Patescibacteria group bacterium]MBU1991613.1 hypothetical protein [Patescibacteria group bacterium]